MRARWMVVGICLLGLPLNAVAEDVPASTLRTHLLPQQRMLAIETPNHSLLDQWAQTYTTPKAVAAFLRDHFTFKRDEDLFGAADYWQAPEEFAARKRGDCEDYALLAQALLARNWITAYVFSLFGDDGYAHTVCVFVDEHGRYGVINQDQVRYYRAPSLEALASQMHPGWTFGGIVEQDGTRGRMVREITNEDPRNARLVSAISSSQWAR